jgi:hypothetical protein
MTAPSEPEPARESRDEEQEIVLRLRDILPRVPAHLLKPGPHDTESEIRFSVEELAEKISRGRVSVPLERLSRVCPEVFRDKSAFQGEQEVPLPLQKLLEQVGLVARKGPAANGMPGDQLAQARAQAAKIISAGPVSRPAEQAAGAEPAMTEAVAPAPTPAAEAAPAPGGHQPAIAKAISTARHILGLFGLQGESPAPATAKEEAPSVKEQKSSTAPGPPPASSTEEKTPEPLPTLQTAPPAQPPADAVESPPTGPCISVRVLPIFRLLSGPVLRAGALPAEDARMALPLALIDPQLVEGHVEVPVEDFVKGLPEELKEAINPVSGAKIWIPLDEIFQNLPPDHLFHMPSLDLLDEPVTEPIPEPAPTKEEPEKSDAAPVNAEADNTLVVTQDVVDTVDPAVGTPVTQEKPSNQEATPMDESSTQSAPVVQEAAPEVVAQPPAAENIPAPETPAPIQEAAAEAAPAVEPEPAEPPQPIQAPAEPPAPSRAPWMRGFQVPPPRLFGGVPPAVEAPPQPATVEPTPAPPATPEAKRTADFLASQTGIFAAAAFVEGAVFASTDFPRKPDLDALREFMGAFIDSAREHGRRLGWNRVLTIPCEQFHLTAVVRDSHFIVALHHDRVLASPTYDALIRAADELGKAGG